ncbi:MAG: succinate dehydrogenase iron-sulfur subunit [Polyangiaceae bacterium]|nr:succinate dehydrogenase iron-sulfur subunit [Polyangiaceae bacterium]
MSDKVRVRVLRQDAFDRKDTRRWEEFEVARGERATVLSALRAIQRAPRTVDGRAVAPVAWETPCLEHACGVCTMLVNGVVGQACTSLLDVVAPKGRVSLAPLGKFPLVRDLWVDRQRMTDDLKRVRAFVGYDGSTDALGESPAAQAERLLLASCTSCGACLEACPQYHHDGAYVGAAAINQARLVGLHEGGALDRGARLDALMGDGGIASCGKAQNCVEVCPQGIPLTESLGSVARDTSKRFLFGWLLGARR